MSHGEPLRSGKPLDNIARSFAQEHIRGANWKNHIKSVVYPIILPIKSYLVLKQAGLIKYFDLKTFTVGGRGSEFDLIISYLKFKQIFKQCILLQGIGRALEFGFWTPYKPSLLIGTDYFTALDTLYLPSNPSVHMVASDLCILPFRSNSFDGVGSINTYEHLKDLDKVLSETYRILKPGGWILASFGPLYLSIGGDHFSLIRGGMRNGFNHLLLNSDEYQEFVNSMIIPKVDTKDGVPQGLLKYVDDNLFSHLTFREYKTMFQKYFRISYLRGHIDVMGLEFRKNYPDEYATLLNRGYHEEDLLVSSICFIGEKNKSVHVSL